MALDQYSKRQKFFLAAITVLGAALFTVTGAMLAVTESCGQEGALEGNYTGSIAGHQIDRMQFQMTRRVIDLSLGGILPQVAVPVFPDEHLSTRLMHYKIPAGRQQYPLFAMWPRYHDQDVWLFYAAVKKAEDAGFEQPPLEEARDWYFVNNPRIGVALRDREAQEHFDNSGVRDINRFLTSVAQLKMLNDYVSSLVQEVQPSTDELLGLLNGRNVERKAHVFAVDPASEAIMAAAEAEYEREQRNKRVASVAARMAGAGMAVSQQTVLDDLTRGASTDESNAIDSKLRVAFDVVYGDIDSIRQNLIASSASKTEELQQFYQNMRGTSFVATADDRDNLDQRVEDVMPRWETTFKLDFEGDDEGWKAFVEKRKKSMRNFLDYFEVENEVLSLFARFRANQAARYGLEALQQEFRDIQEEKREAWDRERNILTAKKDVSSKSLDLLTSLRSSVEQLRKQTIDDLKSLLAREYGAGDLLAREARRKISTVHGQFAANTMNGRLDSISNTLSLENLERQVNEKEASLDAEERTLAKLESEEDESKTAEEREEALKEAKANVERLTFELEAANNALELGKKLRPQVDAMLEQVRRYAADLELQLGSLAQSGMSIEAVKDRMTQLVYFELPAELRNASKDLGLKEQIQELRETVNWANTRIDMRQNAFEREVEDASDLDFSVLLESEKFISYGLQYEVVAPTDKPVTMEELAANPDWYWIAELAGASSFLTNEDKRKGATSTVIERPGYGFYLFRIRAMQPGQKAPPANVQATDRVRTLAIKRIARRLAKERAEQIRSLANSSEDAATYLLSQVEHGAISDLGETGFFGWNTEVEAINPMADPDRGTSARLSASNPYSQFFQALLAIDEKRPVSKVFIQGQVAESDPALNSTWHYCLAVETGRRVANDSILPASERELLQYGFSSMGPELAAKQELMELLNPAALLKKYPVEYLPTDYKRFEDDKASKDAGKSSENE